MSNPASLNPATGGSAYPHCAATAGATRTPLTRTRRVTDAPTRMFHWLFALSFAGAYVTAESEHFRLLHVTLGYSLAGLLVFRLAYGIWGPRSMGLGQLWRKASGVGDWLRSLWAARGGAGVNWRQAQNLGMAVAIVLMLASVVPLTLSGYATYNEWGDFLGGDWLEEVHEFFGNAFLMLVLGHLALLLVMSVLRRKNQALPMLTGRMPGPGPDLVPSNRSWLAALLLLCVLAFGAWQWYDSPNGLVSASALSGIGQGDDGDDD